MVAAETGVASGQNVTVIPPVDRGFPAKTGEAHQVTTPVNNTGANGLNTQPFHEDGVRGALFDYYNS